MTLPAAFRGSYADWRLVKTRAVIQVIFEVPLADADAAYDVLGGMPDNSKERWFGIAALRTPEQEAQESIQEQSDDDDGPRRNWRDVEPSAQAAMRCNQPEFWAFLREEHKQRVTNKEDAATVVRKLCKVNSRAHFNTNHAARMVWHGFDTEYQAWLAKERVG